MKTGLLFRVFAGSLALIGTCLPTRADPPTKKFDFAVIKPVSEPWSSLEGFGCKKNGGVENIGQAFSFISCSDGYRAVNAAAVEGWSVVPISNYNKLGLKNSFKLTVDAFIDPYAAAETDVRYFFSAMGATPEARKIWLSEINKKLLDAGVTPVVTSKNADQTYSTMGDPAFASAVQLAVINFLDSGNSKIGVSFPIEESSRIRNLSDVGLNDGTKIIASQGRGSAYQW